MPTFEKVNIEITNICNLQCSFCPEVIRTKGMMPVDLFERVVSEVAPFTKTVALHLMGDPLLHPELPKIFEICKKADLSVFFVTNGLLLRDFDTLLHPTLRQVSFSLHSFPDNFPEKDPKDYLDRIFRYTEIAFEKSPKLFINYRLWNRNSEKGRDKNNVALLELIEQRFQVKIPRDWDFTKQKNIPIKKRLSLHYDVEFTWPSPTLPIIGERGTCYGLRAHFGILMDGTVVPCCLDKEGVIPLGNIKDSTLLSILNSERAKKIVKGFQDRKLVEDLCQRCQYIERFKQPVPSASV